MGTYLDSYDKAQQFMAGARSKPAGRPLGVSSFRLYQEGDEYVVRLEGWHGASELCRFLPNNTLIMTAEPQKVNAWSHTLTATSGRALPLYFARFKKGQYRVEHMARVHTLKQEAQDEAGQEDRYGYWSAHIAHLAIVRDASEYFKGMIVDLNLKQVINGIPDAVPVIDKDRRKVWLRDLKRFKKMVKARFKLGLAEAILTDLEQLERDKYRELKIDDHDAVLMVYDCMVKDEYPMELFTMFVRNALPHWYFQRSARVTDSAKMLKEVNKFFDKHSVELRKEYGVITGVERPAS